VCGKAVKIYYRAALYEGVGGESIKGGETDEGSRFPELRTLNLELRTSLRAFFFEDFPLRLKPVIKGTLAGALFVDLAGSRRDPVSGSPSSMYSVSSVSVVPSYFLLFQSGT